MKTLNHPIGTIFAVYTYNGARVYRIRFPEEMNFPDAYVNERMEPVNVVNTNDLHTIQVRVNGVLQSPWNGC